MEQEKKTAPQERGAAGVMCWAGEPGQEGCPNVNHKARCTLADLLSLEGVQIGTVADALDTDKTNVMEWVCGKVPDAVYTVELARLLRCPVEQVYMAIVNTPNLLGDQEEKTAPVAETQKRLERLLTQQFRIGDIRVRADAFHRSVQELDRAFSERSNAVKGFLSMRWYRIWRK